MLMILWQCIGAVLLAATTTAEDKVALPPPVIKSLNVHSLIKFTYARTLVSSRIANPAEKAQEVSFGVVLPEEAFITGFVMTINNKSYDAYVKEKEEAKKEYDQAVSSGTGAAHIFQDSRNSKDFTVSVNVEAQGKVTFNLTYEELLSRKNKTYKDEIHINPRQIVDDLSVLIEIEDVLKITRVRARDFAQSNEIEDTEKDSGKTKVEFVSPTKVTLEWRPSVEEQKALNKDGVNGKLVAEYDVDSSNSPQQILVDQDGYFVHFFRNDDLPVLNKHVIFVLDVSGSMHGTKINQLKDAMIKILSDLGESDYFSIVLFSVKVLAWTTEQPVNLDLLESYSEDNLHPEVTKTHIIPANKDNVQKAMQFIKELSTYGGTNIYGGLLTGLKISKHGNSLFNNSSSPPEPLVIFLTDGEPNVEISDPEEINKQISKENKKQTAIFSLSFGYDADLKFLKKLSLSNFGFARRIYVDSDAALQLNDFYKSVASPLLSDVKIKYTEVENVTNAEFKNLFSGSQLVSMGKLSSPNGKVSGEIEARTRTGVTTIVLPKPIIIDEGMILPPPWIHRPLNKTYGYLEKMWAYKTIKSLLDKNTVTKDENVEKAARELALKYSFVTPLTSLVVIKPNQSAVLDDKEEGHRGPVYAQPPGFGNVGYNPAAGLPAPGLPAPVFLGGSKARVRTSSQLSISSNSSGVVFFAPPRPQLTTTIPSTPLQQIEVISVTDSSINGTHRLVNVTEVEWLNQTSTEEALQLSPSAAAILNTKDVVALTATNKVQSQCSDGNPCLHFVHCALEEFAKDVNKYTPYRCHIDPTYLGVCCPIPTP